MKAESKPKNSAAPGMAGGLMLACGALLAACASGQDGCCNQHAGPGADGGSTMMSDHALPQVDRPPPPGSSVRVGGRSEVKTAGENGNYRSGVCVVDTVLPNGYPVPTPPGALEIKSYPPVRLAEVTSNGNPDSGMNRAFWPLFRHIQRNNIPMTSPVEVSYSGLTRSEPTKPRSWSMAFLYRTPEAHATGIEGEVSVRDSGPTAVLAAGLKGSYSMALVQKGMERIEAWLGDHPEWEVAGEWRTLYYNGPTLFFWDKWSEVQLPIRRANGG